MMEMSAWTSVSRPTFRTQVFVMAAGTARLMSKAIESYAAWVSHAATVPICSLLIGMVSAYDTYLTIKYVQYLPALELNPVGRWLMALDTTNTCTVEQVALFLGMKFAGTVTVLFVLQLLLIYRKTLGGFIATKVALFQVMLVLFLTCGPVDDPNERFRAAETISLSSAVSITE